MKNEKVRSDKYMKSGMNLKDNAHASSVKGISTDSEQYDLSKIKKYSAGSKGYPSQALPNSL